MIRPSRRSREFLVIRGYYVVIDAAGISEPVPDHLSPGRFIHPGNAETGGAMVTTGTMSGAVEVQVEVLDDLPAADHEHGWEETEEKQLRALGDTIAVYESEGDDRGFDRLEIDPGQTYHLRVHVRGREAGRTYVTGPDSPVEHHLVQLWPST